MIFHCPVSIYVHIIMSTLYKHLFLRKYNHVKVFKRNIDIDYIIHLKLIMYKKKKSTTRPLPRRRRDKPEWNGPPETKPSSRGSEGGPDRRGGRWKPRSAFRVSLPSPRQTSTPPHTRALPTKFTNPPEAQKFPRQGKIPSEIQRSKSVRLLGAPPNPSRIPQIPAEIPQSSVLAAAASSLRQPRPRISTRGFRLALALSALLPPQIGATDPSSRTFFRPRGRGSSRGNSLSFRGGAVLFIAAPALCLYWSGAGWRSTRAWIDSSSFLRSVVSNPSLDCSKDFWIVQNISFGFMYLRICSRRDSLLIQSNPCMA
jgi:hypothetical protein